VELGETDWYEWLAECCRDIANEARYLEGPRAHALQGLHGDSMASLTGQDKRALKCVAACWELYASSDEAGGASALAAIKGLLRYGMQRTAHPHARALIARAMDWSDVAKLWPKVWPT
jgi:hypothetical protein